MKTITFWFLVVLGLFVAACAGDDDSAPGAELPSLKVEGFSVVEGDSTSESYITVTLEGTNLTNVLVSYASISETAFSGSDYLLGGEGKLQFGPEDKSLTVPVEILGDKDVEPDEVFEVLFFNPVNALLEDGRIEITIQNDDNPLDPLEPPVSGYTSPMEYDGYNLVWSDEFDGNSLSQGNWNFEIGTGGDGWGNNELQYYRAQNTSVEDGLLIIEARKESYEGSEYTSSRITSEGKQSFQYGRVDIRAALPIGQGFWPALWMLGNNFSTTGWPACGEIDIMELVGFQPNRVHGTAHWGANNAEHEFEGSSILLPGDETYDQEFHVFSIIWEEDIIEWYMDDQLYFTLTPANVGAANYPFNDEFFFIFNVAVGGDWPGSPDASTNFPRRMFVDYVRVFQPE